MCVCARLQYGSSSSSHASSCTDKQELQELATRSLQVFECRRLLTCGSLPYDTTEQQLLVALCVLRAYSHTAVSDARAAARALVLPDVKKRYQRLALVIHPDKVAPEHQGMAASFDEAFKVLGRANELLTQHCGAS